jgi:hypothetical protein
VTVRSFSLGRPGEAQWERLQGAYILSRRSGEIVLVASDSRDVRDEVRRRLQSMAPRVEVIEPGKGVTLAIHACAKTRAQGEKIPVAWIEAPASAPSPDEDMQWIEALALLNQTRDALQMHGPCHVVLAGPRALQGMVRRRAPDLTSFMGIMLLLDDTLEELVTNQGTLTWTHVSDLHVHGESWQQDHVLGGLVRDLPRLLDERELRPDLLFVTGDVAARGQRVEYDGAFIVLEQIAKLLGLDRRQHVFMVPGNHDVDRGRIGRLAKRDHASLLELDADQLRDAVGELLGDAKEFALYGERLGEWCAFTDKLLGRARSVSVDRPWRSDVVDVGGLPVGVLSLCTAWASGPEDRKGSLILGERQIHDMLAEARDGGAIEDRSYAPPAPLVARWRALGHPWSARARGRLRASRARSRRALGGIRRRGLGPRRPRGRGGLRWAGQGPVSRVLCGSARPREGAAGRAPLHVEHAERQVAW